LARDQSGRVRTIQSVSGASSPNYVADFWKQVLTNLTVHETVTVQTGGDLAIAIRIAS
jgi:hypothetical protein